MSVKKFKFVSPGVFLSEVDNSQVPRVQPVVGPLVVGRTQFGPALKPVTVQSFSEFVETFGNPIGGQAGGDVWREGNRQGPTYGVFAAQAYLRAGVGPVTMVRLLGKGNPNNTDGSTDPALKGAAGWALSGDIAGADGGAYALVLLNSASAPVTSEQNAYVAAIWYMEDGQIELSGTQAGTSTLATGTYGLFAANSSGELIAQIKSAASDTIVHKTAFNFNNSSRKFIREVFNTNPQLVNSDVVKTSALKNGEQYYWLGETFESNILKQVDDGNLTLDASLQGMIIALGTPTGDTLRSDMRENYGSAQTGYFFSQDVTTDSSSYSPDNMTNLFRIIARDAGENAQATLKVSIENIKASTSLDNQYGTFDLVVRRGNDSDNVVKWVERFTSLNLNPASEKYIGLVIGDKYIEYDEDQQRLREYGQYDNNSKYIRVDIVEDVDNGQTNPVFLPFGVIGPQIPATVTLEQSGTATTVADGKTAIVVSSSLATNEMSSTTYGYDGGGYTSHTASIQWPQVTTRISASAGALANTQDAYFGAQSATRLNSNGSTQADRGWSDLLRAFPAGLAGTLTPAWKVSLDDVVTGSNNANWASGSRALGNSATAVGGTYESILDAGYDNLTSPLYGGFDGLNIKEIEPFRNSAMTTGGTQDTEFNNYAVNTIQQALHSVSDPEAVEFNLLAVPGITNSKLTQQMIDVCEDRADALAVIDLSDVYAPFTENTESFKNRITVPDTTVATLRTRGLDSSYACTYYPWVQIRDTINSRLLWAPPSVVALGVMAGSEAASKLWFAPAGFNRGGLTEGSAGIPVTGVTYKLTSKERDTLYTANVNPIASFPSEGIVVFGQKTLQVTQSALDRINVRRLMIYIKKEVSRISSGLLFDQNVSVTWNRFLNQVNPFLNSIQSDLGLTEFRVILDDTTTTPDLVDQNIMYAKIFLKPARSIEFIAVDFVITRSGASFDD